MSMAVARVDPSFMTSFPLEMEPGILYVSLEYKTCAHLCACGCGEEVVTPLSPAQWRLTYDGETVSLAPSVGNWALPCRSHYWIDRGRIRWAGRFIAGEVSRARNADRRDLQRVVAREATPSVLHRALGKILRKPVPRTSSDGRSRVRRSGDRA